MPGMTLTMILGKLLIEKHCAKLLNKIAFKKAARYAAILNTKAA